MKFLPSAFFALSLVSPAQASPRPQVPIMGWSSWNHFRINIDEVMIREQADATISFNLAEIGIDAGAGYALRDLWQRKTLAQADRAASQSFTVPAHGVLALRIKGKPAATPLFAKESSAL